MSESPPTPVEASLSREESAFFMRSFWTAIEAPNWPRSHLIEFGQLAHAKTPLAKFNESQLSALLPHLRTIAISFGESISKQVQQVVLPLPNEEIAYLIKILWGGIITPDWTSDALVELGKVVFTKTPLSKIPNQQFEVLFPYLTQIANKVGSVILNQPARQPPVTPVEPPAEPSPAEAPPSAPSDKESQNG
jgi:hypothetical protein